MNINYYLSEIDRIEKENTYLNQQIKILEETIERGENAVYSDYYLNQYRTTLEENNKKLDSYYEIRKNYENAQEALRKLQVSINNTISHNGNIYQMNYDRYISDYENSIANLPEDLVNILNGRYNQITNNSKKTENNEPEESIESLEVESPNAEEVYNRIKNNIDRYYELEARLKNSDDEYSNFILQQQIEGLRDMIAEDKKLLEALSLDLFNDINEYENNIKNKQTDIEQLYNQIKNDIDTLIDLENQYDKTDDDHEKLDLQQRIESLRDKIAENLKLLPYNLRKELEDYMKKLKENKNQKESEKETVKKPEEKPEEPKSEKETVKKPEEKPEEPKSEKETVKKPEEKPEEPKEVKGNKVWNWVKNHKKQILIGGGIAAVAAAVIIAIPGVKSAIIASKASAMTVNAQAWHSASLTAQAALHAQNIEIAKSISALNNMIPSFSKSVGFWFFNGQSLASLVNSATTAAATAITSSVALGGLGIGSIIKGVKNPKEKDTKSQKSTLFKQYSKQISHLTANLKFIPQSLENTYNKIDDLADTIKNDSNLTQDEKTELLNKLKKLEKKITTKNSTKAYQFYDEKVVALEDELSNNPQNADDIYTKGGKLFNEIMHDDDLEDDEKDELRGRLNAIARKINNIKNQEQETNPKDPEGKEPEEKESEQLRTISQQEAFINESLRKAYNYAKEGNLNEADEVINNCYDYMSLVEDISEKDKNTINNRIQKVEEFIQQRYGEGLESGGRSR